jgi:hypothetical protein
MTLIIKMRILGMMWTTFAGSVFDCLVQMGRQEDHRCLIISSLKLVIASIPRISRGRDQDETDC